MGCCSSTAADVARQRQQREIAANGLREACRRGDPVMIKALMRDEFAASSENFVNTADESGNRPLHMVIAAGDHAECVLELLTLGADPEAVDPSGLTPLLLAAIHRRPGSARVLLEYGADHTVRGGVDNLGVVDHLLSGFFIAGFPQENVIVMLALTMRSAGLAFKILAEHNCVGLKCFERIGDHG